MKNEITYVVGSVTNPINLDGDAKVAMIMQVCNDIPAMGAGVAKSIYEVWPENRSTYMSLAGKDKAMYGTILGNVYVCLVTSRIAVANMIAQLDIRWRGNTPPIRYDALKTCFTHIVKTISPNDFSLHIPFLMGCDLAGGDWEVVEKMINEQLISKGFEVVVYDLHNKRGEEELPLLWKTEDGRTIPITRVDDLHLANINHHVDEQPKVYRSIITRIKKEVRRRNLSKEFLDGAPYPFFDPVDKVWRKWCPILRSSRVINREKTIPYSEMIKKLDNPPAY